MKTLFAILIALVVAIPAMAKNPQYQITVNQNGSELGKIVLELYPDKAPLHCRNFDSLVSVGFYNGSAFHRVIPEFMIQGGDPNSISKSKDTWGMGDPSLARVNAEFSTGISHTRGVLSAARSQDPNSASSQFFICHGNPTFLDGQYSSYGKVVTGMEVVDKVANAPRDKKDNPNEKITMTIIKMK